jgi:hypothetical protein
MCVRMYVYVCMYVYLYVLCMYVCMYTYIVWLKERFLPELNHLRALGIKFAGIALDNENTSNAFFDELQNEFEW